MFDEEEPKKEKPIDLDDLSVEEIEKMIKVHQQEIETLSLLLEKKKENILPSVQSGNLVGFAPPFELEDTEEKKGRDYKNLTLRSEQLDVRESTGGNRDRRVGLMRRNEEQISSTGLNTFRVGFKDFIKDERKKDEKVFNTEAKSLI